MALADILKRIDVETDERVGEIVARGELVARERLAGWAARADRDTRVIMDQAAADAERIVRQAESAALLAANRGLIESQRKWMDRVRQEAQRRLLDPGLGLYRTLLGSILDRHLDGVTEVILSDDPVCREVAAARGLDPDRQGGHPRVTVAAPGEEPQGGVILRKGNTTLNFSIPLLMDELSRREEIVVARILLEGTVG
jgi:vacuolar-type H+-ATPase subunit E/Vma4